MLSVLILLVLALIIGALVGCVGIGGLLLPPTFTYVGGREPLGFEAGGLVQ